MLRRCDLCCVQVPAVSTPKRVDLLVLFTGDQGPPRNGDPDLIYYRSTKSASTQFQYYAPSLATVQTLWCLQCNAGSSCVVNGLCANGVEPLLSSAPLSGGGALTVVLDNFPTISLTTPSVVGGDNVGAETVLSLRFGGAAFTT